MMARRMRRTVLGAHDQRISLIVTKTDEKGDDFQMWTNIAKKKRNPQLSTKLVVNLHRDFRKVNA